MAEGESDLHSTILLTPRIEGMLCDSDLPDCIVPSHPLPGKDVDLPKLREDLIQITSLLETYKIIGVYQFAK